MRGLRRNDDKIQWILLLVWVVVNLIGIVVGTLVVFVLYAQLNINSYDASSWANLLGSLAICGGVQGIIVGGLQAVVLALARLRVRFWVAATVTAMALGMALPMAWAILTRQELTIRGSWGFDHYVMGGWALAWVLAGIFQGALAGQSRNQIIRWGLANAGAGLFWGVATACGILLLGAVLDHDKIRLSILLGVVGLVVGGLVLGGFLNAWILLGLIRRKHQQLKRTQQT